MSLTIILNDTCRQNLVLFLCSVDQIHCHINWAKICQLNWNNDLRFHCLRNPLIQLINTKMSGRTQRLYTKNITILSSKSLTDFCTWSCGAFWTLCGVLVCCHCVSRSGCCSWSRSRRLSSIFGRHNQNQSHKCNTSQTQALHFDLERWPQAVLKIKRFDFVSAFSDSGSSRDPDTSNG